MSPTDSWPTHAGDLYNRQYSPLDQINRDNVSGLKGVWRTHLKGSGMGSRYSGEATPIVYDGVAYVVTGANDVFALSIENGEILWEYQAKLDPMINTVCCGWTSRGVGMGPSMILVGQLDGKLKALNKDTGAVLWEIQAERWQEAYTITSAPLYFDGLVITGFAGGERGIRGRVKAYDAEDGSLVWTFYTIPGPEEFGHDTWPDNDIWQDGGGPVWQTPAVDPELGLIYFSTGNPGPDWNGRVRAGDNLFTTSILALDVKTGEYRWHFQEVHHDIWDYDAGNPVVLFDIEIDGVPRKGLSQAGKTGWLYLLDRVSGEPLLGIDERPVPQQPMMATSATQRYPRGDSFVPQSLRIAPEGYRLINQGRIFTPFWIDEPVVIAPGIGGGAHWPPSAYDPNTGHIFVCASDKPFAFQALDISEERPEEGVNYPGGVYRGEPMHNMGILAALDVRTNKLVWQQYWNEPCYSGNTVTAGGLLFVGRNDGRLTAVDVRDGKRLWQFQTGAGMNAPVSIFSHEGKQYVIAYSAGNALAPSAHGDSVWLFSLDGTMDEAEPPGPALPIGTAVNLENKPADGEPDLVAGERVFQSACSACHGEDGRGGHGGGISLVNASDFRVVASVISRGRNNMPALGSALTPIQLRDVADYVSGELAQQMPTNHKFLIGS